MQWSNIFNAGGGGRRIIGGETWRHFYYLSGRNEMQNAVFARICDVDLVP